MDLCFKQRQTDSLRGETDNFNEAECNVWSQVCHWSIRTSEPIQHINLPAPLLTKPHQCQPLCCPTALFCPFPTHTTTERHWCQSKPKPTQDDSLSSECKLRKALFMGFLLFSWSERNRSWNDADNLPANHKSMQLQIWSVCKHAAVNRLCSICAAIRVCVCFLVLTKTLSERRWVSF